jgi:hypothetical protein
MFFHRSFYSLLLFLHLVPSLQGQKVKVEYDPKESFARFKTYSWITEDYYQRPISRARDLFATAGHNSEEVKAVDKGLYARRALRNCLELKTA